MSSLARQLPLDFGGHGSTNPAISMRHERRERTVRMVEHAPFPRVFRDEGTGVGYTRDLSASGMCLAVERAPEIGAFLRVIVRGVDGRPTLESLARVVWYRPEEGRFAFLVGLHLVEAQRPRMLQVRHAQHLRRVAVRAQGGRAR